MSNNQNNYNLHHHIYKFDIEVSVNDTHIPLNSFAERMIANTIIGMLSSLKQVPPINETKKIEIKIKDISL